MGLEGGVRTRAEEPCTRMGRWPSSSDTCCREGPGGDSRQQARHSRTGQGGGGGRLPGLTQQGCTSLPGGRERLPTPTGQPGEPQELDAARELAEWGPECRSCLQGGLPPRPLPPSLEEKPPPNPPVGARPPEEGSSGAKPTFVLPLLLLPRGPALAPRCGGCLGSLG